MQAEAITTNFVQCPIPYPRESEIQFTSHLNWLIDIHVVVNVNQICDLYTSLKDTQIQVYSLCIFPHKKMYPTIATRLCSLFNFEQK